MKICFLSSTLVLVAALAVPCGAQSVNAAQAVVLEGLRTSGGHGSFVAVAYAADGSLFLLYDQNDGVRVLKTDAGAKVVLAQAQLGAAGDAPVAMSLDPSGNVYVTGTTTSGSLHGTAAAAFPAVADASTNSFVAKFDANLNLSFVTFLGAGRTAAAGVAATADGVFVTGVTYSAALPVTAAAIQQAPANGSSGNGFVERFNTAGTALIYATYLTGANGSTAPTAIVADSADNVYVTGATTAPGYPTIAALQTAILGPSSGFLTSLNAAGSAFGFSTFLAGNGITGLAFDSSSGTLLLTGNVSLGQFPVATVAMPLVSTSYQTLLRILVSGQTVSAGVVLAPGTQSYVSVGTDGSAWVAGALSTPLFAGNVPPDYSAGNSFLVHVTSANSIDQTLRLGGVPVNNASYASLTSVVAAPAVNAAGTTIMVPGKVIATVDASLLAKQRFDLPSAQPPNAVLPNTLADVLSAGCTNSSACQGTGGLVAEITTSVSEPSLSVSANDLPNLTLRNLGSAAAMGLSLSISGFTQVSDCGAELAPSSQCGVALTGSGPGTLTISAANAATETISLGSNTLTPNALSFSTRELDFGIVTSVDGTAIRSVTVTNLSASSQSFNVVSDGAATTAYTFAVMSSTCAASLAGSYMLAAGSSCVLTFGLTASSASANDGAARAAWKIGTEDIVLTGFTQAAALSISASKVDFGTVYAGTGSVHLPRYLYLSNNSRSAVAHTAVMLPGSSPFSVADGCPPVLEPQSVCQLTLTYSSAVTPSNDTTELALDESITVLVTGETLPQTVATGSAANPSLSVSTMAVSFATPVVVTQVSSAPQTATVTNTGAAAFVLTLAISGDFTLTSGCPATLAAKASCSISIGFAPSQPGTRDGLLSLTAGSGFTPTYVSLTGTGSAILPSNNGMLAVGETYVGEPLVAWYRVQQTISSLTATSSGSPFLIALVEDTGNGHGTLAASEFSQSATLACASCWLGVQYLSPTAGTQTGQLTLSSTAGGGSYILALSGTALPVTGLLLSPITQEFGTVAIHSTSGPVTFTLANLLASGASVTVQSAAVTGDFSMVGNSTGGANCAGGGALAATASCTVQVVYSPTAMGDRSGTLTLTTTGGTVTTALTGYGAADTGLGINPVSLTFNNVPGQAATEQTLTLTNTGSTQLTIGQPSASDPSFTLSSNCSALGPGAVCTIAVIFTPQTATTSATLSIPVSSTVNGQALDTTYTIPLSGAYTSEGAGLEIVPTPVNFGSTATGAQGETRTFTLNNLSGKALSIGLAMPRAFPLASSGCATLASGASCSFAVSFLPVTGGALTGSVVATGTPSDGSSSVQTIGYMLGYGAAGGVLDITGGAIPNSGVSFGQVSSGQSTQQSITLTNSGTGSLTIHRLTSQPPFYTTSNCGAALAAGAGCTVTFTYAPVDEITSSQSSAPRSDTGMLTIESDAATSPDIVSLNGVVVPVVSGSPASAAVLDTFSLSQGALTFANTQVGDAAAAQTVTLTNTGSATVHVLSVTAPTDFTASSTCGTLLAGNSCTLAVAFTPTTSTTANLRSGALEIASDASTSLEYISLVGTSSAAPLTLSPAVLQFGTVDLGGSDALTVTVSNTVATPVTFNGLSASGDYAVTGGTCPAVGAALVGSASCTLTVTFTPTATGLRTGLLSLSTSATTLPLTVSLSGTAVKGQLQISPGALAFGSVDVASPSMLMLTLLNTGTATVTGIANALGGANAGDFAVTIPCSVSSLAPNQGCTETVTFTPQTSGGRAATLTISSSDPNGPASIPLSGTGVVGGSFVLSVNGASTATLTVASGSPASYPLTLTPLNGYAGAVALTCAAVSAGQYATCSVMSSTLSLNGAAQTATATINTITSAVRIGIGMACMLGALMLRRRKRGRRMAAGAAICGLGAGLALNGCGGAGSSKLKYTPAGSYVYQVTASSTSGTAVSSTVTLQLIVQ